MIRLAWRLTTLVVILLVGLLILLLGYRWLSVAGRNRIKQHWSTWLVMACGLRVVLNRPAGSPTPLPDFLVMNHVSWLDIFVLNSVLPATFVAKAEIRRWPLIGWLVAGSGTIFVERGSRHAVRRVNQLMAKRLAAGERVAFFPEGTTSDGTSLLPFHTSLFASAMESDGETFQRQVIQPIALIYFQRGRFSTIPAFVGEQTLVQSIVQILTARDLVAEIRLLPVIDAVPPPLTRHALAAAAEHRIRSAIETTLVGTDRSPL
jgi:1-acyl-sn-glycerol-3-phosphate acyltransferase